MNKKPINIDDTFNKLKILSFHHKDKRHRKFYLCECSCGNKKVIHGASLKSGNTKSCGCLSKEEKRNRKLPNNSGIIYQIFLGYKRHAKDRNLIFSLTRNEFEKLVILPCYYCGIQWSNLRKNRHIPNGFKHNGIDRIDSKIGYTTNNCVPCCKNCNLSKMSMTKDEFLEWIRRVYEFQYNIIHRTSSQ